MQKIVPMLWFDSNAEEAVSFYTSVFPNSKTGLVSLYNKAFEEVSGKPAGSVSTVDFTLNGQEFTALNGGPMFKFTPAVSMFVQVNTVEEGDAIWSKLSEGGFTMMGFQEYPFAKKYGWCNDKFGMSWQVIVCGVPLHISQSLMFVGKEAGKAEEAINYYVDVFKNAPGEAWKNSKVEDLARYEEGEGDTVGFIKHGAFVLAGETFKAMGSSYDHKFGFSEATSFLVYCDTQEEIDYFYDTFAKDGGQAQPCGWVIDKFGVAWQIDPAVLPGLMAGPKGEEVAKAMFGMTKLDIAAFEEAAK
jgi:predicted 3-demethylubiquinone-9 3-methyltransferase (glyoxalase superfamily)